jgi:outer membrane cobalamin receptor
MRLGYFCLFALALSAGEPSKILRGVVLDPANRPIAGARIQCGGRSTFSNTDGRFTLPSADPCDSTIEKDGFVTGTPKLTPSADARIVLTIQGPVENVIVTATRSQATPEQAAVAANTIAEKQLLARDLPSIADALREIPDVNITTTGRRGDATSLFLRGSSSTSTLVLLDGVPLNDPGGQINLAHLTSNGIDRIEVVRGPESTLFGAEASAGVIQIFTRRGNAEEQIPHGMFEYERGNFQTDRWLAGLNGGYAGRLDYSLHADQFHSAGAFPNDFYRNNSGSANVGYRISDATQIRGIFRIYDAHLGAPGQVAYQAYDYAANEETRDETVSARVDDSRGTRFFQTLSFGYHHLNDRFNENEGYRSQPLAALVRDVGANTYFVDLLNPAALPTQIPAGDRIAKSTAYFGPYPSLNITERKTVDYQGTLAQTGGALVFGYAFQDQSGNVSGTEASRKHNGFFANEQYSLGSRIHLSGGLRVEHSSAFGTYLAPRAGGSVLLLKQHGPLDSTFLRLSAGRGILEPSLYENYVQSQYAKGNPALRPEKTNSYEAAIVQEWAGRRIRTEVAAFRSSFHDLITYVYPSWQNIEQSWARGVEFSGEAKIVRNVSLSASYTRLSTRVVNSVSPTSPTTGIGVELLRRPKNGGSLVLSATPKRFTFVAGARFVGDRHDSDYAFGITRNPGYENVFASASYTLSKHFTPILRLDNLLNERYQEALGYSALSRTVLGGMRISW